MYNSLFNIYSLLSFPSNKNDSDLSRLQSKAADPVVFFGKAFMNWSLIFINFFLHVSSEIYDDNQ